MTRCRLRTVLLLGVALCASTCAMGEDLLRDKNGKDSLGSWACFHDPVVKNAEEVWSLKDGVLTCKGQPKGYLYTKKSYTDFTLKLQWRWAPGEKPGKGGVLFRMTGDHKNWPTSLEAQINAGGEGDLIGLVGYDLKGPAERYRTMDHEVFGKLTFLTKAKQAAKAAGEWNDYEITAKGGAVTLRLNGVEVNRATDCGIVAGPILLTSEGNPIQFRNITLTVGGDK